MNESLRCWKTEIWTSKHQPERIYGATLEALRLAVRQWLLKECPTIFATIDVSTVSHQRVVYFYTDGTSVGLEIRSFEDHPAQPYFRQMMEGLALVERPPLEIGWYAMMPDAPYQRNPQRFPNLEAAIDHYIQRMIIELGPDHRNRELTSDTVQLSSIAELRRENDILQVRDLLQQGWLLLAIEHMDRTEKATSIHLLARIKPR